VVVRLFVGTMVLANREGHSVDRYFAIHQPSEFAPMSKPPVSCQYCDEKKRSGEPAEFAACGTAYVDGAVHRTGSVVEWCMFFGCNFPSKGSRRG
jgi:hypothetical protein